MKIGLYFGSFNPIHHGHLIIANYIVQNTNIDQVWFIVSPQNPLKPAAGLLNEYHRLYLIKIAIEGEKNLRASDIEFGLPKPSYTSNTLAHLHEKHPEHEFSIIMGSDSFQNITRWKNYEYILKNYPIYIYKRPNHDITQNFPDASIIQVHAPLLEISATHIRESIKNGKSIRYLVPEKVQEEIEKGHYYKK
ncbi:MAG TPA: nicotinate (nicotinamide) nucleotide adenylyltransferase [Puia sp.]|jgi:nicotinate-nucleotide adenylyltransferase|nr:nicotinate (nicotinamide) nucleotide adenylyltransferase [Puia sp.]